MKVFFRVDASHRMGIGHLIRCLTLAEALSKRGVETRFICREHRGHLIPLLQQRATPVTVLPASISSIDRMPDEDYGIWLGVTQAEDSMQTIKALNGEKPDWLIVDHYGLDVDWERRLRSYVGKIMVIDDLANRNHDCDILLDQNYFLEGKQHYTELVPDACKLLMGPRYALLRLEYITYRQVLGVRNGKVKKVLIFFGGSDPQNMTGLVLEVLSLADLGHLEVDVVVGANNPHREGLEKQARERPLTKIYGLRPHLADLMIQADLAIGAGGATTWERMCLGLPTIVISIAESQRSIAEALAEAQLICYAGHFSDIKKDDLVRLTSQLSHNPARLSEMSMQNQLQVDGFGTLRLTEILCPSDTKEIHLRPACEQDSVFCYKWIKDSEVHKSTINESSTPWVMYQEWFTNKLYDVSNRVFIFEVRGLPVGQLRFNLDKNEVLIDDLFDMIVRDRNWESRLVVLGLDVLRRIEPLMRFYDRVDAGDGVFWPSFLRKSSVGKGFSITILSNRTSWMNDYIQDLLWDWLAVGHRVLWVHDIEDLRSGDFCFYLSCEQIVPAKILSQYRHNLVVHESELPKGKGWSPLTWQVLKGKKRIPITLFEAEEKVDSGVIYAQEWLQFEGHELIDELRYAQARATISLCKRFIDEYPQILTKAREQIGEEYFYPRRLTEDSQIDPAQSIEAQFDLLRVIDNQRYPAFFDLKGQRYLLRIDKGQL